MNFEQIKAFLAVVEYGTFTEAANSLFLTQTALGHRITNLEEELKYPLFVRNRGIQQVKLTEKGAQLLQIAKEMDALWQRAQSYADQPVNQNVVISCGMSLYNHFMPDVLNCLMEAGYRPVVISMNTKTALQSLQEGAVDFALSGNDVPIDENVALVTPLVKDKFVVLSNPDSTYGEKVSVKALDPNKEIFFKWNNAFIKWHQNMFGENFQPRAIFENIQQIGPILRKYTDRWVIAPANYFQRTGTYKHTMIEESSCPERIISLVSRLPLRVECHDIIIEAIKRRVAAIEKIC